MPQSTSNAFKPLLILGEFQLLLAVGLFPILVLNELGLPLTYGALASAALLALAGIYLTSTGGLHRRLSISVAIFLIGVALVTSDPLIGSDLFGFAVFAGAVVLLGAFMSVIFAMIKPAKWNPSEKQ